MTSQSTFEAIKTGSLHSKLTQQPPRTYNTLDKLYLIWLVDFQVLFMITVDITLFWKGLDTPRASKPLS